MNKTGTAGLILAAFLVGFAGAGLESALVGSNKTSAGKESTYDRVMRTQTIQCGYGVWPPEITKDPATGQLSGVYYEYMQALGAALHLKIAWAGEVGWGDFPAALEDGRIDAMCAGVLPDAPRARQVDFVHPIFYSAVYPYMRADDHRFENAAALDDAGVTLSTMDGDISHLIAASDFPRAKTVQLPQMSNWSELLANVTEGKADATFVTSLTAAEYERTNPGKIRRLSTPPLRVFSSTIAVGGGQDRFRRMLDTATDELIFSGRIEKILEKYEPAPGTLLRPAPPYEEKKP
jgi:polar amino acid transport system substrate-binding protein